MDQVLLLDGPYIKDGFIQVTDKPGLGIELNPDVVRAGNGGRVQWVSGRPGEAPEYAGTDFIIARDGRIAAVYLFFDKLS